MKVAVGTFSSVRPRPGWCGSRAAHVCDLNDVFFLYVCLCIFSEYVFTLYSKQINNYKLILLACECVYFCGSLAILFFFLEAAPIRILQNRWGPKTGSLLVCVSGLSVCSISAQPFCWEIGTVQLQLRLFFCLFLPFRTKIEHLKLLHCCIVCFSQ